MSVYIGTIKTNRIEQQKCVYENTCNKNDILVSREIILYVLKDRRKEVHFIWNSGKLPLVGITIFQIRKRHCHMLEIPEKQTGNSEEKFKAKVLFLQN